MKHANLFIFLLMLGALGITAQTPMNWTLVNTGTNKHIRDISFINRDTGFIAGDNGLFKMTTNGGTSWTDLTIPATGQGTGNNSNIKVAQFYDYGGPIAGVLFFDKFTAINRTYDLSSGWMEECGGTIFSDDSICSINNFHHSASFTQYTAGGNCTMGGGVAGYFGGFCFTFDSLQGNAGFTGWNDVTSNANDEVIMVGPNGSIGKNSGGFPPFTYMNSGSAYDYLSVDWSDTSTVYAANNSDWFLERSTDGGNTFVIDSTIGPTFFYPQVVEMDFTDNDWGVMACTSNINYGLIVTKRGSNIDFFMTDSNLTSTYVVDSTLAFAAGLYGKLYKYDKAAGVGIESNIDNLDFSIFPNPQNVGEDVLNLVITEEVKEIFIYDMLGKVLFSQKINQQGVISLPTGINQAGTYIIRLVGDKGVGTQKWIVN